MGIGIALMTVITTYLVHTSPTLNMADLTDALDPVPAGANLYMPNYTGGVGESGLLEIKSDLGLAVPFDSFTFSLKYSPVNALIFQNNPIVFDSGTQFQDAAFQMTASPEDGKLIVTIILDAPITIAATQTLFKLNTQLNAALPVGQVVDVTFEDLALLDGVQQVPTPNMPVGTITVQAQNELKALNAEAIDSTHVVIEFSDYLTNVGVPAEYIINPGLVISAVESGTNYGYSLYAVPEETGLTETRVIDGLTLEIINGQIVSIT